MSLVCWLPLNGTLENKGVSNVTVTNNGAAVDSAGKIGSCYYFNGSAWIKITVPSNMTTIKNTSVCAWIKSTSSTLALGGISHDSDASKAGYTLYSSGWQISGAGSWKYISGGAVANTNVWHHVCCTIADNAITTYLNGVQVTTNSLSSLGVTVTDLSTANFIEIGCDHPGGNEFLTGYVNDFRVYDHCLSAAEVHEISQGLVLHYKLDSGSLPLNKNIVGTARYGESASSGWGAHRGASTKVDLDASAQIPWHKGTKLVVTYDTSLGSGGGCGFYLGEFTTASNTTYCYSLYIQAPDDLASLHANWLYRYEYNSSSTQQIKTGVAAVARSISLGNHWYRIWGTFTTKTETTKTRFYFYTYPGKNITYYFGCPQVELGSTMTPWNDGNIFTTITDSSGYGHNGSILNTITLSSDTPRYSASTNLTAGNSMINCGRGAMVTDSLTVNLWIKYSTWGNPISCTEGGGWNFENSSGIQFPVYIASVGYKVANAGTLPSANTWHMITGTYNRLEQTVNIYIDGELKKSTATGSSNLIGYHGSNVIWIGAEATGSNTTANNGMIGLVSDARIYCTALSADDILSLYHTAAKVDNLGGLHTFELNEFGSNKLTKTGIFKDYMIEPFMTLADGSKWQLLLYHYVDNGNNLFTSSNAGFNNGFGLYSRLNYIDNFTYDNKYEFYIIQDGTARRWTQTNAPLTTTAVAGFTAVSGSPNNGICKCSGNTLLAVSNSTGNWWHACGCWTIYQGGIPGFNSTVCKQYLALYARISEPKFHIANLSAYATNLIEK